MKTEHSDHWLVRPRTIKTLWYGSILVLASTIALEFVIPIKSYFSVDNWTGFGAIFGFISCLMMVLLAKGLGYVLKRDEGYYSRSDQTADEKEGGV